MQLYIPVVLWSKKIYSLNIITVFASEMLVKMSKKCSDFITNLAFDYTLVGFLYLYINNQSLSRSLLVHAIFFKQFLMLQ